MEAMNNDSSKEPNPVRKRSVSSDKSDIVAAIGNIVSDRAAQCNNLVLASQIQKAVPIVTKIDRRGSLHAALHQMSQESLLKLPDVSEDKKKEVKFVLPKKSLYSTEVTLEEYVVPGNEHKLLTDSFVRNLPVPIEEKRNYRRNIVSCFKRKPWYLQLYDFISRHCENFKSWFYIWHGTLKCIEGQHGAAVVAYFLFIRWLLFMNIGIFLLNLFFLVIPQCACIEQNNNTIGWKEYEQVKLVSKEYIDYSGEYLTNATSEDVILHCQKLYSLQLANNTRTGFIAFIQNLLQGTGPLESTYLFLGSYSDSCVISWGYIYNIPLASLCVFLATLVICLIMMINYSSVGIQEAFLARNKCSNYYSNEVFSAWDYAIDNPGSAAQKRNQFVFELKTSLSEDRDEKKITARSTVDWTKLYAIRFAINLLILIWLWACYYIIYTVIVYQLKKCFFVLVIFYCAVKYILSTDSLQSKRYLWSWIDYNLQFT